MTNQHDNPSYKQDILDCQYEGENTPPPPPYTNMDNIPIFIKFYHPKLLTKI